MGRAALPRGGQLRGVRDFGQGSQNRSRDVGRGLGGGGGMGIFAIHTYVYMYVYIYNIHIYIYIYIYTHDRICISVCFVCVVFLGYSFFLGGRCGGVQQAYCNKRHVCGGLSYGLWDRRVGELEKRILGSPVVPFYRFFFGGGFPYKNGLQKKIGYPASNLSTGGPMKRPSKRAERSRIGSPP